jgi:hypothetical protein
MDHKFLYYIISKIDKTSPPYLCICEKCDEKLKQEKQKERDNRSQKFREKYKSLYDIIKNNTNLMSLYNIFITNKREISEGNNIYVIEKKNIKNENCLNINIKLIQKILPNKLNESYYQLIPISKDKKIFFVKDLDLDINENKIYNINVTKEGLNTMVLCSEYILIDKIFKIYLRGDSIL